MSLNLTYWSFYCCNNRRITAPYAWAITHFEWT